MNNLIKYIASFILILAGILISVFNQGNNHNQDPLSLIEDIENSTIVPDTINVPVDLDRFQGRIKNLKAENPERGKILPFVIATTKTCPPCNDNIVEYADVLGEYDLFFEPTLVFVDEQAEMVDRFLLVNDLQLPYVLTNSEENESIAGLFDHLVFIDLNNQNVFYSLEIPTITVSLSRKEQQVHDVSAMWQQVFDETKPTSAF